MNSQIIDRDKEVRQSRKEGGQGLKYGWELRENVLSRMIKGGWRSNEGKGKN